MSMALFSSPSSHLPTLPSSSSSSSLKTLFTHKPYLSLRPQKPVFVLSATAAENGSGGVASAPIDAEEKKVPAVPAADSVLKSENGDVAVGSNGSPPAATAAVEATAVKFEDPKWVGGTWDLQQFRKDGKMDWDAVIDAEVKRRKFLQDKPESSNNDEPIVFDTSIIPWWAWVKRFHLPEAELLNGRAAMIGFFMAYLVDSLTGVGLVDQMGNFFCKSLLFVAVVGVLVIRKNEDVETVKRLVEESTFYDKQWQATWVDDQKPKNSKKD